jgi:hypothetical protein
MCIVVQAEQTDDGQQVNSAASRHTCRSAPMRQLHTHYRVCVELFQPFSVFVCCAFARARPNRCSSLRCPTKTFTGANKVRTPPTPQRFTSPIVHLQLSIHHHHCAFFLQKKKRYMHAAVSIVLWLLVVLSIANSNRQKPHTDTLIVWNEPHTDLDYALSFQQATGCMQIWEQIQVGLI